MTSFQLLSRSIAHRKLLAGLMSALIGTTTGCSRPEPSVSSRTSGEHQVARLVRDQTTVFRGDADWAGYHRRWAHRLAPGTPRWFFIEQSDEACADLRRLANED